MPDNFDALFGDADDSSNIFRDLDDIIGAPNAAGAVTDAQPETDLVNIEFSPDEEDVENQLMHIDDQLIRLDENIEDITDHLDEQLLNTATVENDALLSVEEENLLFSSMPEVTRLNPLTYFKGCDILTLGKVTFVIESKMLAKSEKNRIKNA